MPDLIRHRIRTQRFINPTLLFRYCLVMIGVVSMLYIMTNGRDTRHTYSIPRQLRPLLGAIGSAPKQHADSAKIPHQHVLYLKTHKTGSTTIFSILAEYCRSHDLLPLVPSSYHISQFSHKFYPKNLKLIPQVSKYDMLFNHMVYNPDIYRYLYNDTFAVTTLREPFSNIRSAFYYYRYEMRLLYLMKVPGADPFTEFLRNPKKYESGRYGSLTNNRQSVDLGFDPHKSLHDIDYIKVFLKETDQRFNLVLVMEYFDEGLVMLKRALNWRMEDIIYLVKNQGATDTKRILKPNATVEALQRKFHAESAQPDIMLYDHYLKIFEKKMRKEKYLTEELVEFKKVLKTVRAFCNNIGSGGHNLVVPPGTWNEGFTITPLKCHWLDAEFFTVTKYLQKSVETYAHIDDMNKGAGKKEKASSVKKRPKRKHVAARPLRLKKQAQDKPVS